MSADVASGRAAAVAVDAVIAIPCVEPNFLVRKCVAECVATCPGAEIVVVADRSGPGDSFEGAELVVTGFMNMAAKRNLVARQSSRTYLGLIDSDAYPDRGWMQSAIGVLEREPQVWMVGGPNVSPPGRPAQERYVGAAQRSFLVTGSYSFRKKRDSFSRDIDDLPSCNMILRRENYLSLGGMREDLYMYEDKELCAKVLAVKKRIRFSSEVVVFHKDRPLWLFAIQRLSWGASLWEGLRRSGFRLYLVLPTLAAAFFLSAPLAVVVPYYGFFYLAVLAVYFTLVAIEAVRHAGSASDILGTLLAIVIGNLGPGLGSLLGPLRLLPDTRKIYRNAK